MKLIEIKNSLAKLHYEPNDFKLVLSDFLTIDDGNQKILAQVVSIETTTKDTTNSAILKFCLNLNNNGTISSYNGYVPPLDALVSKTPKKIINDIFSDESTGITLGQLTNTSEIFLKVRPALLEDFLYIQSDRYEQTQDITSKILAFNNERKQKTLYLDFENLNDYPNYSTLTLGKDFKLPIDSAILNYIYENDLTGLTVEQKTIVQDIIIEIQEYIDSLESGFISFNTLLGVVDEIYETDKSVGIILLRNKLLKYKQLNIFASEEQEIYSIQNSMENNPITVLKIHKPENNWKQESINFILSFLQNNYFLVFNADEQYISNEQIKEIYKNKNIKPIVISKYESELATLIKSFAKNLILYKPMMQQRAFATYNSFLNKLSAKEFIVSGENTYYTPLIIKELTEELIQETILCNENDNDEKIRQQLIELHQNNDEEQTIVVEPIDEEITDEINFVIEQENAITEELNPQNKDEEILNEGDLTEMFELEEIAFDQENAENTQIPNILEDSIEQEIAEDVDRILFTQHKESAPQTDTNSINTQDDDLVNINVDLLNTIETNDDLLEENLFEEEENTGLIEEDLDFLDSLDDQEQIQEPNIMQEPVLSFEDENLAFNEAETESITANNTLTNSIPVYQTELDNTEQKIKFSEGNSVYHEKYGHGVVEQLINYGNKTFCAISFDNIGIRLIDPNVADLKHM